MIAYTTTLVAALASLSSVYAVTLHVNTGCITYYDADAAEQPLCKGHTADMPADKIFISACVDRDTHKSSCSLSTSVDATWQDVYWGADDCLYSAGNPAIQVDCAKTSDPPIIVPFNPYLSERRSMRIARDDK